MEGWGGRGGEGRDGRGKGEEGEGGRARARARASSAYFTQVVNDIKVCTLHFGLVREPDRLSSLTQ